MPPDITFAASVPVGSDVMQDEELDGPSGLQRGEGEAAIEQARIDASPGCGSGAGSAGVSPGGMRVSQTLTEQLAEHGAENLVCASCEDQWRSEMASPGSEWVWWGAKAQVKGSIKKTAGSNFALAFYLCAHCRRHAYQQARDSVHYLPGWMKTPYSVDSYYRVNCEGMAVHAACKVLHRKLSDLSVDSIWVAED